MASPHIGCKEEDLVFIVTEKLDFTIKGMPCHPKAESLNLNKDASSQLRVWCEELLNVKVFLQEENTIVPAVIQTKPLFFEQQNYEIVIENKGRDSIEFWHENNLFRDKVRPVGKSQRILSGIVNFGNEIGFSELDIKVNGKTYLKIYIEVFPSKVDYQTDYIQILQDVNQEIYNLAFDFLKKTYLWSSTKETVGNSLTEFYSIINILFKKFIGAVNIVTRSPHHILQSENMVVPFHKLRRGNSATVKWLERHPQYLIKIDQDYIPQKAMMTKKTVNFDTFENRFIKYILNVILKRLNQMKQEYYGQGKNYDEHVLQKIIEMTTKIHKCIEYSFLKNVGQLHTLNTLSLVLNMAPGYKDVYKYYLILIKGLSLYGDLFKISVKDLALLYEYWCFIKLNSLFRKRYELLSQDMIKVDHRGLIVTLKKGTSAKVIYLNPENGEKFTLTYNPKCNQLPTISQKPDNVLSLEKQKSKVRYDYIFDAKYRINPALDGTNYKIAYEFPGPEEDDINTMHRYRDAIVQNARNRQDFERTMFGAYVLFPYSNEELYKRHKFYTSIEKVNIGGLPFLPSSTSLVEQFLYELIDDSPESAFERSILPKGTNDYINEIDFNHRDVLVGALSKPEQLAVNLEHKFYHIPCCEVSETRMPLRYIAIYQSNSKFRESSGIKYYGEISYWEKVRRGDILEIPTNRDANAFYYKFYVKEWRELNNIVKPKELRVGSRIYTNLFLLFNAEYVPELCIRSKEEYRLYMELKRIVEQVEIIQAKSVDDILNKIDFEGGHVVVEGNSIKVLKGQKYKEFRLETFISKPRTTISMIKRFVLGSWDNIE